MIQIRIHRSIKEIDKSVWNALTSQQSIYFDYDWLASNEQGLFSSAYYICAYTTQNDLVAAAPAYVISDPNTCYFPYNIKEMLIAPATLNEIVTTLCPVWLRHIGKSVLSIATRLALKILKVHFFPMLICTTPYGYVSGFIRAEGTANQADVTKAILEAMDSICEAERIPLLALLYLPESQLLSTDLAQWGFQRISLYPDCFLDIEWESFDQYIKSFRSKQRRNIRTEIRRFHSKGLQIQFYESFDLNTWIDELIRLEINVATRYDHGVLDPEVFRQWYRQVIGNMLSQSRLFVAYRESQPVGFTLLLQKGNTYYVKLYGLDYDQADQSFAYFNLVFYAPIQQAIAQGMTRVYFGPGGYEAKLKRGCHIESRYGAIRFKSMLANAWLRIYLALYNQAKSEWPNGGSSNVD